MAKLSGIDRRKARVRRAIKARAGGRPRLSVFRSDKNIYAQIIDDANGRTLAAASSVEKDLKIDNGANQDAAAPSARPRPVSARSSSIVARTSIMAA
jgi:large subunit ribosomal protein L18